ncbi:MAG: hypothetical protein GY821_14590 [Gammaproteobacteria bacterium]|nr:hypothetical protein [Gammaproteobacteria bacterium]
MAYNYLGLVNDINRRLNEVELSTANFSTATGFYSFAKDAVNAAISHINQEEFEWPFNHVEETEVLLPGEVRYSMPYDAKTVNMNSFRIKRDDTLGVETVKLKVLNYEEYLDKYADSEYNSSTDTRTVPRYVVRAPSRELIFVPAPDKAYEVVYEYYSSGFELNLAEDVPALPEAYRHVINDGAMYYVYFFRSDLQAAQLALNKFEQGIKHLRSININRTEYVRDTRVRF